MPRKRNLYLRYLSAEKWGMFYANMFDSQWSILQGRQGRDEASTEEQR